jgi:hypothetical protein
MAVNASRNMNAELEQGAKDGRYIMLNPMWSTNTPAPVERMAWPTYARAERHQDCECVYPITPREPAPKGGVYTVSEGVSILPGPL